VDELRDAARDGIRLAEAHCGVAWRSVTRAEQLFAACKEALQGELLDWAIDAMAFERAVARDAERALVAARELMRR